MIELGFIALLNFLGDNICEYRDLGYDNHTSMLLAYSDASHRFGTLEVKKVVKASGNVLVSAYSISAIKCPHNWVKEEN